MHLLNRTLAVMLTLTWVSTVLAVPPPPPPCGADTYRAFDFWLGDWQVHSLDGQLQGTNSITSAEDGCLLIENWRGAKGGTGQSYNYFDPTDGAWHQLWVSPGVIIDYSGGPTPEGAMRLEGTIHYRNPPSMSKFTGQWTPREDGTVLQELKQYNAKTGAWDEGFTGVYTRATQQ